MNPFERIIKKERIQFIYIGLTVGLIGLFLAFFYRPFIYNNNFNDFHFADTLGSLFCVPASVFISYGLSEKYKFLKLLLLSVIFWVIYEIPSSIEQGIIDTYDYLAIIIGALLTFLSFKLLIYKKTKKKK